MTRPLAALTGLGLLFAVAGAGGVAWAGVAPNIRTDLPATPQPHAVQSSDATDADAPPDAPPVTRETPEPPRAEAPADPDDQGSEDDPPADDPQDTGEP